MTIYERPTKSLMTDWAKEALKPEQTFTKDDATRWFAQHYPRIKGSTVNMHVEVMSTNNRLRRHFPSIKPGSGHDLFYKLGPDEFRLWKRGTDPRPFYKGGLIDQQLIDRSENSATAPLGTREVATNRSADRQRLAIEAMHKLANNDRTPIPAPDGQVRARNEKKT